MRRRPPAGRGGVRVETVPGRVGGDRADVRGAVRTAGYQVQATGRPSGGRPDHARTEPELPLLAMTRCTEVDLGPGPVLGAQRDQAAAGIDRQWGQAAVKGAELIRERQLPLSAVP